MTKNELKIKVFELERQLEALKCARDNDRDALTAIIEELLSSLGGFNSFIGCIHYDSSTS